LAQATKALELTFCKKLDIKLRQISISLANENYNEETIIFQEIDLSK
jgi:hypothetical protein